MASTTCVILYFAFGRLRVTEPAFIAFPSLSAIVEIRYARLSGRSPCAMADRSGRSRSTTTSSSGGCIRRGGGLRGEVLFGLRLLMVIHQYYRGTDACHTKGEEYLLRRLLVEILKGAYGYLYIGHFPPIEPETRPPPCTSLLTAHAHRRGPRPSSLPSNKSPTKVFV